TSIPSNRPAPDTETATVGSESLLQASLRINVLMTHSIGPAWPRPAVGSSVPGWPIAPAGLDGSAESTDACVTWAIPPLTGLHGRWRAGTAATPFVGSPTPSPHAGRPACASRPSVGQNPEAQGHVYQEMAIHFESGHRPGRPEMGGGGPQPGPAPRDLN